jgi:hypothetical protein
MQQMNKLKINILKQFVRKVVAKLWVVTMEYLFEAESDWLPVIQGAAS